MYVCGVSCPCCLTADESKTHFLVKSRNLAHFKATLDINTCLLIDLYIRDYYGYNLILVIFPIRSLRELKSISIRPIDFQLDLSECANAKLHHCLLCVFLCVYSAGLNLQTFSHTLNICKASLLCVFSCVSSEHSTQQSSCYIQYTGMFFLLCVFFCEFSNDARV